MIGSELILFNISNIIVVIGQASIVTFSVLKKCKGGGVLNAFMYGEFHSILCRTGVALVRANMFFVSYCNIN